MAEILSMTELERLPVTPYDQVRSRLQSGDLFFAAGRYEVSRAIQQATRSPWSHVGIIFHFDSIDRKLMLESVEDIGVRLVPVTQYLNRYHGGKPYDGIIVVARFLAINPEIVVQLGQFGTDMLMRHYTTEETGRIMSRLFLKEPRKDEDESYLSAELVSHCFSSAGYDITYNSDGVVRPGDLWADHHVSLLARIH